MAKKKPRGKAFNSDTARKALEIRERKRAQKLAQQAVNDISDKAASLNRTADPNRRLDVTVGDVSPEVARAITRSAVLSVSHEIKGTKPSGAGIDWHTNEESKPANRIAAAALWFKIMPELDISDTESGSVPRRTYWRARLAHVTSSVVASGVLIPKGD